MPSLGGACRESWPDVRAVLTSEWKRIDELRALVPLSRLKMNALMAWAQQRGYVEVKYIRVGYDRYPVFRLYYDTTH